MRKGFLALCLLMSAASFAQTDSLPRVPSVESIDLRLEQASVQLKKSANTGDAALYMALLGTAITLMAVDDHHDFAVGAGVFTAGAFYALNLKSNGHKRKAAALLHQ